jgi:hypothetical protein
MGTQLIMKIRKDNTLDPELLATIRAEIRRIVLRELARTRGRRDAAGLITTIRAPRAPKGGR